MIIFIAANEGFTLKKTPEAYLLFERHTQTMKTKIRVSTVCSQNAYRMFY